jgi:hypothetical protein
VATQLRPGVFTEIMAKTAIEGTMRARRATTAMALITERQAKINVSHGAHSYDTPTPASEGTGPAVISGTLRRCITHTPVVAVAGGWMCMVGPAPGFYTPYGIPKHHIKPNPKPRADSARYGYYLETGDWGHVYPWLGPALKVVEITSGPVIMREIFGAPWPQFA